MMLARRTAAVTALAISLGLHAALLALATGVSMSGGTPSELIRITRIGGGGGGGAAPASSEGGAPPPPQAPPEPAQPQPPVSTDRKQPRVIARKSDPWPRRASAPRPNSSVPVPPPQPGSASTGAANQPPSNVPEPGAGTGSGTGTGTGSGSGGGIGSGSGPGRGPGTGPGNGAAGLRAHCLSCPEPQYPRIARTRGWQGVVDVDLVIRPDGTVDHAAVARSSGYPALDQAALTAARRSRFQLADALPAGVRGRIAYGFRLTPSRQ